MASPVLPTALTLALGWVLRGKHNPCKTINT